MKEYSCSQHLFLKTDANQSQIKDLIISCYLLNAFIFWRCKKLSTYPWFWHLPTLWPLSHVMIKWEELYLWQVAVWPFQALGGNRNLRQVYFWVRKALSPCIWSEWGEEGSESVLELFCPLPGSLPELMMEWVLWQIKVTLIQIIQECETPNHAWGGQKIRLLPF